VIILGEAFKFGVMFVEGVHAVVLMERAWFVMGCQPNITAIIPAQAGTQLRIIVVMKCEYKPFYPQT